MNISTFVLLCLCIGACPCSTSSSSKSGGLLLNLADSPRVPGSSIDLATIVSRSRPKRSGGGATGAGVKPGEIHIPEGYNALEIPQSKDGGPFPVGLSFYIRSVTSINEAEEEITIEMDGTVEWTDPGLSNKEDNNTRQRTLDPGFIRRIWRPDIFLEDLIETLQPVVVYKPIRFKYSSSGHVIFNTRIKLRVNCEFDFRYYPADTQKCRFIFRSFSFNSTECEYKWRRPHGVYLLNPHDTNYDMAVSGVKRLRMVVRYDDKIEKFDALEFTISARRHLSYHLFQTYLPSQLYLGITWLCFMVPTHLVEGRIAIVMTTLLTLTSMFSSVRESTPVVSYTKAIDIWMVICVASVFMVLLECALLLWTETEKQLKLKRRRGKEAREDSNGGRAAERLARHVLSKPKSIITKATKPKKRSIRKIVLRSATRTIDFIESYSFILILLIYILMNGLYWAWLLINSGYFDWAVDPSHNAVDEGQVGADARDTGFDGADEVLTDMYQ